MDPWSHGALANSLLLCCCFGNQLLLWQSVAALAVREVGAAIGEAPHQLLADAHEPKESHPWEV